MLPGCHGSRLPDDMGRLVNGYQMATVVLRQCLEKESMISSLGDFVLSFAVPTCWIYLLIMDVGQGSNQASELIVCLISVYRYRSPRTPGCKKSGMHDPRPVTRILWQVEMQIHSTCGHIVGVGRQPYRNRLLNPRKSFMIINI